MRLTSFIHTTGCSSRGSSDGDDGPAERLVGAHIDRSGQARCSRRLLLSRCRRPTRWAVGFGAVPGALLMMTLLMVTLIAACTSDPPAPPSRDADNQTSKATTTVRVPYIEGAEVEAEAFRALRLLDPCALLVPDAGAQAVGGTADQLLPGPDPAACTLEVLPEGTQRSVDAWTVSVEVGVSVEDTDHESGLTPQPIPGTPDGSFYRRESRGGSACSIVRPVEDGYGIELEVRAPILAATPSQPPCDIAVRYLENTADRWLDPPVRADELTVPRLPLAEQDPCAATHAIAGVLSRAVLAQPDSLYSCRLVFTEPAAGAAGRPAGTASGDQPGPAPSGETAVAESMEITFAFMGDPASLEPTGGVEPVTVAGHVGSLDHSLTDTCGVDVAISDTVRVETGDGDSVQVIRVTAPSCEVATQVAATVVKMVTDR